MKINEKRLSELLGDEVKIFVCDETGSTNEDAKAFLKEHGAEKTLFVADKQIKGKGRSGKSFFSPENGIYMTAVLPNVDIFNPGKITTSAAVAVCKAIESLTNKKPAIKWVNDVYLNGKKICGILCEAVPAKNAAVVGIGINFRGSVSSLPDELKEKAGYLFSENETAERECLIAEITKNLYLSENWISEYKSRMFLLGKTVTFVKNGVTHEATAVDVDENGRLTVKENEKIKTLDSGEVSVKGKL